MSITNSFVLGNNKKKYEASNDKIVCDERVKDKERKKKNKENHPD